MPNFQIFVTWMEKPVKLHVIPMFFSCNFSSKPGINFLIQNVIFIINCTYFLKSRIKRSSLVFERTIINIIHKIVKNAIFNCKKQMVSSNSSLLINNTKGKGVKRYGKQDQGNEEPLFIWFLDTGCTIFTK